MTKLRPLAAFLAAFVFVLNSAFGAAPVITTQPLSQTATAGTPVTFSVTATSNAGELTYQWMKNGFTITGATSASYSITSPVGSNTGRYTVAVTNGGGSTTSNIALLTVGTGITINAVTINTQPTSQTVNAGTAVTFYVNATSTSTETLTYQWQKEGVDITGATGAYYYIPTAVGLNAGSYTVLVANSAAGVISNPTTLAVNLPPQITTQPAGVFVNTGGTATFSVVATGTGTLSYKWQKNGVDMAGQTASSLTINSAATANVASYRVIITDSLGLSTTSSTVPLVLGEAALAATDANFKGDGYAASATGGFGGTVSTATTAATFRSLAEDTTTRIITVSSAVPLDLGTTKVAVKSNKTIQGADASAKLIGNLELATGVSNVIIRGLTITNPSGYGNGDGISVVGASNVYITHCSIYDCTDGLIDITAGADNVTVSWCEFYYAADQTATSAHAMMVGASTGETKALRVTLHHNWWSDYVERGMPVSTWGQIHMHSNLLDSVNNSAATKIQASAQLLSERNQYTDILDPLSKTDGGLIKANNDVYTDTSLTPGGVAEVADDTVFTPSYSYELLPAGDWTDALKLGVGNTAGAASTSPKAASVLAKSTSTTLTAGGSYVLEAELTGFAPGEAVGYQWRFNNRPFEGGDKPILTINNAQTSFSGAYTVLVLKSSGVSVVSSPVVVTINAPAAATATTDTTTGGGGAPSVWFLAALSLAVAGRCATRRAGKAINAG
ncbi:MAG: immunoglobulin domain-containing protein [Nibricoccus sp.]